MWMTIWLAQAWASSCLAADDRGVFTFVEASVANEGGQRVSLPDSWNKTSRSGQRTYLFTFNLLQAPAETTAVYIPRIGNRYKALVNGRQVAQAGVFGDLAADFVQQPQYFVLPEGALRPGVNTLELALEGDRNRYAGLSQFTLGPDAILRSAFNWREAAQVGGSMVVVAICAVFGLLAAALYAALRQISDLYFALSCFFCSVRTSYSVLERAPFDSHWWAWVVDLCYAGLVGSIVLFCVNALGMNRRVWYAVTAAFGMVSITLVSWHVMEERSSIRQLWLMVMLAYVTVVSLFVIARWWRLRTPTSFVLALAAGGGLLIGIHDHWRVYYTPDGYGGFALARFALVLFILAMGWIIVDRLISRMREERQMRDAVASELESKKLELSAQYVRQTKHMEERAQVKERERLVQDLHDGMGLQLNSLLGMVEGASPDPLEVQQEVRHSIEHLRTLVDGSEKFDGTLAELLGQIRYRTETRLRRQGIAMQWHTELGAWKNCPVDPLAALNVQHLLYELCTNVVKHSGARSVEVICAVHSPDGSDAQLHFKFADDGSGHGSTPSRAGGGRRSIERRIGELEGHHEEFNPPTGGWVHQMSFALAKVIQRQDV